MGGMTDERQQKPMDGHPGPIRIVILLAKVVTKQEIIIFVSFPVQKGGILLNSPLGTVKLE